MSRYPRQTLSTGDVLYMFDTERAMIVDVVTGEPMRFGQHDNAIGTLEEAIARFADMPVIGRYVIVKLQCIESDLIKSDLPSQEGDK